MRFKWSAMAIFVLYPIAVGLFIHGFGSGQWSTWPAVPKALVGGGLVVAGVVFVLTFQQEWERLRREGEEV